MSRKNKKCPTCGKEFHACDSCGLTYDWEFKCCSHECWVKSEEYIRTKFIFEKIYNKMKGDSLHGEFIELLEIGSMSDMMRTEICNWIEELEA